MSTTWNVKISDLESTTNFSTGDQFVIVKDGETVKIAGSELASSIVSLTNLATRPYVDAIVDLAPATLDTLRELAQAINNDPDFAATITEAISTKITAVDWEALWGTKNTYHLPEGSNLYFTNERARSTVFDQDDLINFLNGGQVGNVQLTHEGSADYIYGMDIFSPEGHEWVQLNYGDKHYVWISNDFVGIDITNANGDNVAWKFDKDGVLNLPEGGDIVDSNGISVLGGGNGASALAGLSDVSISNPANGQVLKYNGVAWVNGTDETGSGGNVGTDPTFNSVTATQLNVQSVEFTGTGAVTIASGNDLNFEAAGDITFNGEQVITKTQLKAIVAASTDFADFKARVALL
jgi:hypothetical protein